MATPASEPPVRRRPLLITLLGWMLIAVGALQCVNHAWRIRPPVHAADLGIPLFELVILACGIYLLRGAGWARWVALAWVGFHIAVSFMNSVSAGLVHSLIFALFAWLLFRPGVNAWFRAPAP